MSTDEKILATYYRVVKVADSFLEEATGLSIDALKGYDPSIEEIAKNMERLAIILKIFIDSSADEEHDGKAINAMQCANIVTQIGKAVSSGDEELVASLLKQLEVHVKVP